MIAVSTDDPAFQTAAGYVTAYLTGSAEIDRWTAPGSALTAVTPRACSGVHIDGVETVTAEAPTTRAAVVATATCQTVGRVSATTQYGLVLQVRDGRWEVTAEDPALLAGPRGALPPPRHLRPRHLLAPRPPVDLASHTKENVMSDLLITLIAPMQIGAVPLQTITEWLNTQLGEAKTVLMAFAGVAILALTVWRLIKSGFAIGAMITVGVVAALALWLIVGGGIETISDLFGEQAKAK